jgi:hypothetical protein
MSGRVRDWRHRHPRGTDILQRQTVSVSVGGAEFGRRGEHQDRTTVQGGLRLGDFAGNRLAH